MKAVWLAFWLSCVATGMATAQSDPAPGFPSRPIRWIVGFTPGASNDVVARTVAARLTDIWGKQIIIDNRPGAGGMIGGEMVARAAPDGYTVLLATGGPNIGNPLLSKKAPYRVEDFAYVAIAADNPLILVVTPSFPAATPREAVLRLNEALNRSTQDPQVRETLESRGATIVRGTPEDALAFVRTEVATWGPGVKRAHEPNHLVHRRAEARRIVRDQFGGPQQGPVVPLARAVVGRVVMQRHDRLGEFGERARLGHRAPFGQPLGAGLHRQALDRLLQRGAVGDDVSVGRDQIAGAVGPLGRQLDARRLGQAVP